MAANQYTEEFYSWQGSVLDDFTLQDIVDSVVANRYNGLDISGFTLGEPQDDEYYRQLIKEMSVVPMAVGVDFDSLPLPFSNEGFSLEGGPMPRFRTIKHSAEQDRRKIRKIARQFGNSRGQQAVLDDLVKSIDFFITSQENRQSFNRNQIISEGEFEFTDATNPYGVKNLKFRGRIRNSNVTKLSGAKAWWKTFTDPKDWIKANEGADSNVVKDLREIVDNAEYEHGFTDGHFEVSRKAAKKIVEHSSVIAALAARAYTYADAQQALAAADLDGWKQRLRVLGEIIGAEIVVKDHRGAVEVYNTTSGKFERPMLDSFAVDKIVYVPNGTIGEVKVLEPDAIAPDVHYASFMGGRGLFTVDWDVQYKTERLVSELTAIPVLAVPQYIFPLVFIDGGTFAGVSSLSAPAVVNASFPASASLEQIGTDTKKIKEAMEEKAGNKRGRKPKSEETETVNVESEE